MIIKLTGVEPYNFTSAKGNSVEMTKVSGERVDTGEDWEKNFFTNNAELAEQIAEYGVGEHVNVQMVQQGKNWNITGFSSVSDAMLEKVKGSGSKYAKKPPAKAATVESNPTPTPAKAKGGTTGTLTKEEWAEKDRKAKIGMSIHNSLAAASRIAKAGSKPEEVIKMAKEFLAYLMLDEIPGGDTDKDPLDPPN